jgi:hypothetical protein
MHLICIRAGLLRLNRIYELISKTNYSNQQGQLLLNISLRLMSKK